MVLLKTSRTFASDSPKTSREAQDPAEDGLQQLINTPFDSGIPYLMNAPVSFATAHTVMQR